MKSAKFIGFLLLFLHLYLLVETIFWQGEPMPSWRFLLSVFGTVIGVTAAVYLIDSRQK